MNAKFWKTLVGAAALSCAACSDRHPAGPLSSIWADRRVAGRRRSREIGPGALYSVSIPANWNGDLVVFAHG
jgi:hypothetical protein